MHTPGSAPMPGRFNVVDETNNRTLLPDRISGSRFAWGCHREWRGQCRRRQRYARGAAARRAPIPVNVAFPAAGSPNIDLTTTLGVHIDLNGANVENLVVETLADNDTINVTAQLRLPAGPPVGTFTVIGGDSDADTDKFVVTGQAATAETVIVRPDFAVPTDQDVAVNGNRTDVTGVELIQYIGVVGAAGARGRQSHRRLPRPKRGWGSGRYRRC